MSAPSAMAVEMAMQVFSGASPEDPRCAMTSGDEKDGIGMAGGHRSRAAAPPDASWLKIAVASSNGTDKESAFDARVRRSTCQDPETSSLD
jgi:hypothetical protein